MSSYIYASYTASIIGGKPKTFKHLAKAREAANGMAAQYPGLYAEIHDVDGVKIESFINNGTVITHRKKING